MARTPPPVTLLRFVGSRGFLPGVPTRDLTDADLARLVRQRTNRRPGEAGYDVALADRIGSLVRSGLYAAIEPRPALVVTSPPVAPPPPPPEPTVVEAEPESTPQEGTPDA